MAKQSKPCPYCGHNLIDASHRYGYDVFGERAALLCMACAKEKGARQVVCYHPRRKGKIADLGATA